MELNVDFIEANGSKSDDFPFVGVVDDWLDEFVIAACSSLAKKLKGSISTSVVFVICVKPLLVIVIS